jgi:predicted dehydrogenase
MYWHKNGVEETGDVPVPASPLLESPYATQLKAFYEHLLGDAPLPLAAEDALAALEIALAAIESTQTGRAVRL